MQIPVAASMGQYKLAPSARFDFGTHTARGRGTWPSRGRCGIRLLPPPSLSHHLSAVFYMGRSGPAHGTSTAPSPGGLPIIRRLVKEAKRYSQQQTAQGSPGA